MVDKDVFTQLDKAAKAGVKGRKDRHRLVNCSSNNIAQLLSYLVNISGRCIHLDAQANRAGNNFGKFAVCRVILSLKLPGS